MTVLEMIKQLQEIHEDLGEDIEARVAVDGGSTSLVMVTVSTLYDAGHDDHTKVVLLWP